MDRTRLVAASGITAVKLAAYAVLVWWVLARLLAVDPFWAQAGVVIADPPAGTIYMLAQPYEADAERISAMIVRSTLLSILTVPFVAWLRLRSAGTMMASPGSTVSSSRPMQATAWLTSRPG